MDEFAYVRGMAVQPDYKLSIIIPHYNTPDLLEKLLLTIPDNKDIQTIVIDDCSSDEVKKELQKIKSFYKDREILFLENNSLEHNAGEARNIGLKNARGEWLLFADSDDYFLDRFYEIIEKYFETNFDIVFFSFRSVALDTGDTNIRQREYCDFIKSYLENSNSSTEVDLRYRWFAPWSKLIKRSLVDSNNITFDSVSASNDVMFSVKTGFAAKTIAASEDEIYCVTRSKGTLTTKYDFETFEVRAAVIIRYFQFVKAHLTKAEFREVEAYRIAWKWLHNLVRRRYGRKVFMKYLRIFRKNKMLLFDIRMFAHLNVIKWLKERQRENALRGRYEE